MKIMLEILRRRGPQDAPYRQTFEIEAAQDDSVADLLTRLNEREPLRDVTGTEAEPVAWECSCLERKCGACAMRVNGRPRLACTSFLSELGGSVVLEPLSKFPPVRDLIVDRDSVMRFLREMRVWTEEQAVQPAGSHETRYQSARCLMCGCCMEVCPNFSAEGSFAGAMGAVNAYRAVENEKDPKRRREMIGEYRRHYYNGCGKSLSCHDICPAGIPVEELLVRGNHRLWHKQR